MYRIPVHTGIVSEYIVLISEQDLSTEAVLVNSEYWSKPIHTVEPYGTAAAKLLAIRFRSSSSLIIDLSLSERLGGSGQAELHGGAGAGPAVGSLCGNLAAARPRDFGAHPVPSAALAQLLAIF